MFGCLLDNSDVDLIWFAIRIATQSGAYGEGCGVHLMNLFPCIKCNGELKSQME